VVSREASSRGLLRTGNGGLASAPPAESRSEPATASSWGTTSRRIRASARYVCGGPVRLRPPPPASSADVCDPHIWMAPDRRGQLLPLWTNLRSGVRAPHAPLCLCTDDTVSAKEASTAGATELSPSMPSPARSPRLLRPGAWDLDVATAWLPKCWTGTLRKRKGQPRRPPSLTAADRGKRPLSGWAFVRSSRRAGAIASRVRLTPQAAAAPSAPTEAPPWPLPTDAPGHRRSQAWPRS
jgi:hypothetical protein